MPRKQRQFRKETLPDHVRTADSREPSLLATSPATMKSHELRRGSPIIVPKTVKQVGMHKLSAKDLLDLRIDSRYQRDEITDEVNQLILIIRKGGLIPDPISVAHRKYGDGGRYIVDGQQRWWAHVDTETPLFAVIYEVSSFDDEITLFHALNNQIRLTATKRLASMPGPLGDTIRRLNSEGFIAGLIGPGKYDPMTLARGVTALLNNGLAGGSLERVATAFEINYRKAPRIADQMIDKYCFVVNEVFSGKKIQTVAAIAFGRVCYAEFTRAPITMPTPTPAQLTKLRQVDWGNLIPSHAIQWVPTVIERIQSIWPVEIVQNVKKAKK